MTHTTFPGAVRTVAALAALGAGTILPAQAANESRPLQAGTEYMVVVNHPNNLNVLDLKDNSVFKTCALPGAFGPGMVQIAPDRKTAYILNNRFGTIYGVRLDDCQVHFQAELSPAPEVRAKSIFSFALSVDGKEAYAVYNPTTLHKDHYEVGEPRLVVYDTAAGVDARPIRSFPAPRQVTMLQGAADGSLYMVGANIFKVDVHTGKRELALPIRDWQRPSYAPVDVLSVWPVQTPTRDFTLLYTTARFTDDKQDPATAEYLYGYLNVNLESGQTEARDFGPLTEIYFTGARSPKDPNIMFGLLHRLAKYDVRQQKLIGAAELEHTYYAVIPSTSGDRMYLTGTFNDVAIYDADTLAKLGNIELPGGDMSLGTAQVFIR
ncbi:MAG: quinohemoprotein amine dehydrogenase subunit beta [Rhodocyclaceae bacterium]|nr:quinohemoprotein amine dehydrogenase subunit beta [Rhodocyclaceae bacterium]